MEVEIGLLPRRRVHEASLLLARAFADDGILTYYLGGLGRQRIAIPAFFCAVIHAHAETPYAATAGPDLVGVRAAPRRPLPRVRALSPRSSRQLLAGLRSMERLRPPHPHWYLVFGGV